MEVYCAICIDESGHEVVHIFSTPLKRKIWIDKQPDYKYVKYIHYAYLIDCPERMEEKHWNN